MKMPHPSLAGAFHLAVASILIPAQPLVAEEPAEPIIRRVEESLKPSKSFSVLSEIETYRDRVSTGTMALRSYIRISDEVQGPHSVSIVMQPKAERGKVFLRINDAFWLYDPNAHRPVKLSTEQRLMGDASLADVTHFDFSRTYAAELNGREAIVNSTGKNIDSLRLSLKARSRDALYPSLRLWVAEDSHQPVKVECLSSTDRVLKTVFYSRFRGFLGKPRPCELIVVDGTSSGRITRIRFSEFVYRELQKEAYDPAAMASVSRFTESDTAAK